jgi:alkylation response protein AidB-like acyl-CoA dehydrogenase
MNEQYISVENLKFLLYKVHRISDLFSLDYFSEYNQEAIDMVIDAAYDFSNKELFPYLAEMDRQGVLYSDGKVTVHPQVYKVLNKLGESGFINATLAHADGGIQLPYMAHYATSIIYTAANNSAIGYAGLTSGAAHLIISFGNKTLKKTYAEKMYKGIWQGTMALTEPEAGSSLSDITTKAEHVEDNTYKISGQKIFISGGDYTDAENVVHLTLARIAGAPKGTRGISLFVVPKHRVEADGGLVYNDVVTAGVFHKMGQHGYVTTHLMMGEKNNCFGYLVGEENMGLKYMFQMMNNARIEVGLTGVAIASAAYYASLKYAQERRQGRHPSAKEATSEPVKIIEHADVRRMLFMQKSIVEGSASLVMECAKYLDLSNTIDGEEQENSLLMLEILTPIVKTYPTEMGIQSVSNGLQCLGGYGYCQDFPLEQLYRDIRITTLYEGTTGIQSLDLLGRKMMMHDGKAAKLLLKEIYKVIDEASGINELNKYAELLKTYMQQYQEVMDKLMALAAQGKLEEFLADANLFMELTGNLVLAWQWLKQGIVASKELEDNPGIIFYTSKLETLKYYFSYELPNCMSLSTTLLGDQNLTLYREQENLI